MIEDEKINEIEDQNSIDINNIQNNDIHDNATNQNDSFKGNENTNQSDENMYQSHQNAVNSEHISQSEYAGQIDQQASEEVLDSEQNQSSDNISDIESNINDNTESSNRNTNFEATSDTNKIYNETQEVWQMQNFQNNGIQNNNSNNGNSYYKETYKKPNHKKSEVWKYVLVSIISSIVGGAILTIMILGVGPAIQPGLKNIIGDTFPNSSLNKTQQSVSELKKIEITQTSESAVTSVAEKVGPSVVGIRTYFQGTNELFGSESDYGEGSGIIISSDGYILTNHHVIENAISDKTRNVTSGAKIEVYLPNRIDKPYIATVKGYDSKTDLAVLKIQETNLTAIEFGDSDALKVGEAAIAFGNPGGLEYMGSLTTGVISGLNRTVQLDGGKKIRLVQTDAAINPGNSGGALVNIKGQLIGVNTIKMVATGFEGLGFAIPVNDAKKIADELIKNTYISKPYLGITVRQDYTEEIAKANKMPMGVYVASVEILGAAEKGGIQAFDVITKFNKKKVTSYDELEEEKNKLKPGDQVEIEIFRDGKTKTLTVTLGETK